ncbi:unnamed protein product, partial [Polarella glacialis]
VYYWEKIQGSGIVVPYAAHELASQRDKLRVIREHVLRVVRDYNQIMTALSPEERRLFNHHIRTLDRKIGPGLTKYNWTSDGIKEFFVRDSCKECAKVYDWCKQFKKNNNEIIQVCKKISEMHLIKIEKKVVHRDEEFRDIQERQREEVKKEFTKAHEKITDLMLNSYQFFEQHPADIQREWKTYVDKVDKRVEEALKKAVKTSLQDLCKALNGVDTKTEPSPLFRIQAVLDDIKMDFKPPMHQLKDLLQMVCRDMTMTLAVVPRLAAHLHAVKAERDRVRKAQMEEVRRAAQRTLGDLWGRSVSVGGGFCSESHIGLSAVREVCISSLGSLAGRLGLVGRGLELPAFWPGDSAGNQIWADEAIAGRQVFRALYSFIAFAALGTAYQIYGQVAPSSGTVLEVPTEGSVLNLALLFCASAAQGISVASLANPSPLSLVPGFRSEQ